MNKVIYINSKNENLINATAYEAKNPICVLVICSANGVKQTFYKKFAKYMQEHNITVVTFDYAGIGGSLKTNSKNIKNSVYDWANNDLETILGHCRINYPNLKLTILGHSIGGQLIGLTENSLMAYKIILVNAQSGYWGFWTSFQKIKIILNWNVLFPSIINVFDFLGYDNFFYDKISCVLISYSVDDDNHAPEKLVDLLTSKYSAANSIRKHILPEHYNKKRIGHFGLFRENCKEMFWLELKNEMSEA